MRYVYVSVQCSKYCKGVKVLSRYLTVFRAVSGTDYLELE